MKHSFEQVESLGLEPFLFTSTLGADFQMVRDELSGGVVKLSLEVGME